MGFGFALGSTSLRLKGDYLAIVTLAFAQIFKIVVAQPRPAHQYHGRGQWYLQSRSDQLFWLKN